MKPDSRKCSWSFLSERTEVQPDIQFTVKALKWIKALTEEHSGEVGCLGIVREADGAFIIDEIFYPKHCLVTSTTCEIAPEGEVEIAQYLIDKDRVDDVAKVRFWGHSHHTMGTTPSGQDDEQALQKMNNNGAYFIRAIFNKNGEMSVSFFDHDRQLKFENVKWSVCENYDNILAQVISATNLESNSKGKVQAVRAAVSRKINFDDDEFKKITEKVKELKKENIPPETRGSVQHHYRNGYQRHQHNFGHHSRSDFLPSFQQEMFDEEWGGGFYGPNGPYSSDRPSGRQSGNGNGRRKNNKRVNGKKKDNEPLLTDSEIETVVNTAWEDDTV